ncbi:hypothetical protein BDR07DRAFT_1380056 [Suillus spraguei]|nr:hypothetical protein BDR07DRAFT_1380056 [Suillus spraguei]
MIGNAPRKRLAVMSVRRPVPQAHPIDPPSFDEGTICLEASTRGTNPREDMEYMSSRPKRTPLIVMAQPVKFWPDGEEPPFTGQKARKRTFVTEGKGKPSKEITANHPEIDRLNNAQRSKQIFHPKTGDILLYHDYSDYEDSESDFDNEYFQIMDDVHVNSGQATSLVCGSKTARSSDDDDEEEVEVYDGVVMTSVNATPRCQPLECQSPEFILLNQSHSKNPLAHLETAHHWIKRGKKFPLTTPSTPYALQQLCTAVLTVPTKILEQILPPKDISVKDFIDFPVPNISMLCSEGSITFREGLPTSEVLPTTELPRMTDVTVLRDKFGQALLDGKCSIFDPRFKDKLLPLWTIEFWWQLHLVHNSQAQWKNAQRWIQRLANANLDVHIFREAANQLCKLPANDTDQTDFVIASTDFSDALLSAKTISYHDKPHIKLLEFENAAKKYRYLCAPVHLSLESHFIAFEIDFQSRTFQYGDSLNRKRVTGAKHIITRLQWWFEKRFNGKFTDLGPTLPHGQQKDYCSCGLFAINTIEHRVFGYPLGVPNPAFERARWFALTAKDQILDRKGPGSPEVLPAASIDVLPSGQDDARQDSETYSIKDTKNLYAEQEAERRASRSDTSGTVEQESIGMIKNESLEQERAEKKKLEIEKIENKRMEKERLEKKIFEHEKAERNKEVHDIVMDDGDSKDIHPGLQVTLSQSLEMEVEPETRMSIVLLPIGTITLFSGTTTSHFLVVDPVPQFAPLITIVHARPVIVVKEAIAHPLLVVALYQGVNLQRTSIVLQREYRLLWSQYMVPSNSTRA